ncbi:MAG: hypothetical protein P8J89_03460 [Phycisphaerales bacterium]|nr:hypothetical protein [Phycisphaerales bacterium]
MMLKEIFLTTTTILTTTLISGCSYDYQVQMGIKKNGVQTSVSTNAPLMPVEKQHLEKAFGKAQANPNGKGMPAYPSTLMSGIWDDGFGGTAMLKEYESPLGTTHVYMNMMGGDIQLYEDQKLMHDCLDMLLDMTADHIKATAQDKQLAGKIAKLADGQLRTDLHDILSVMVGVNMAVKMFDELDPDSFRSKEMQKKITRKMSSVLTAFLYQRGWINEDDAAILSSDTMGTSVSSDLLTASFFRAIELPVTGKNMRKVSDEMGNCLNPDFGDKLRAALTKKCEGHPHLQVAINHASELLTSYSFDQSLQTGDWGKPTLTLGSWNDTTSTVSWSSDVSPWSIGLLSAPTTNFAVWTLPGKDAVKTSFQKPLSDDQLAILCVLWSNADKTRQDKAMKLMTDKTTDGKGLLPRVMNALSMPSPDSKKD